LAGPRLNATGTECNSEPESTARARSGFESNPGSVSTIEIWRGELESRADGSKPLDGGSESVRS